MAAPFRIFIPKPKEGEDLKFSDISEADATTLIKVFSSYAGHNVTCGIGRSRPTAEEKEARIQAKADKKAATVKANEEKATAKAQKAEARTAKKAEKEADKAAKKASKKTELETAPAPDIKKAAEKAINAPAKKKSHHNPAKGY